MRVQPIGSRRLIRLHRLRRIGNWVNLTTPLGLLVCRIGRAQVSSGPHGLLLADRYRFDFPIADAFTIGDVVITSRSWSQLLATRPNLLLHEERHSWQYFGCGGLPFFPLYGAAMLWSWLRTGTIARGNIFETSAGLADGGYA